MRVLCVCLGNICRSPSAEAVLRAKSPEHWKVDSAGTGGWHIGKPPYAPAIEAGRARGYDLSPLRARQFSSADFGAFDVIVAMDRQNLMDVERQRPAGSQTQVRLLIEFASDASVDEVPDPYYTGDFEEALDLIELGVDALIAEYSG